MKKTFNIVLRIIIFVLFTALTQIGGLIFLLSLIISNYWKTNIKGKISLIFIGLYTLSTFLIVPLISPFFGREKIHHSEKIKPASYGMVLLNRNYITSELQELLTKTEKELY